jgi:hypothetical protein
MSALQQRPTQAVALASTGGAIPASPAECTQPDIPQGLGSQESALPQGAPTPSREPIAGISPPTHKSATRLVPDLGAPTGSGYPLHSAVPSNFRAPFHGTRPFDKVSFVSYMTSIGGRYQNQAMELISICRDIQAHTQSHGSDILLRRW